MITTSFILSLLVFFGALNAHQMGVFHWVFSAILVVIAPFVIYNVIIAGILSEWRISFSDIFSINSIVILIAQLLGAIFIFRLIEAREDSISTWVVASILGCISLYVLIPYFASLVIH